MSILEVLDATGKINIARPGSIDTSLPAGRYLARLRNADRVIAEHSVCIQGGSNQSIRMRPLHVASDPQVTKLINQLSRESTPFNLTKGQAVSRIADPSYETTVKLISRFLDETTLFNNAEMDLSLGLKPFRPGAREDEGHAFSKPIPPSGLKVLLIDRFHRDDVVGDWIGNARIHLLKSGVLDKISLNHPPSQEPDRRIAQFTRSLGPGSYWLSIALPAQSAVLVPVTILSHRVAEISIELKNNGQLGLFQQQPWAPFGRKDPAAVWLVDIRRLAEVESYLVNGDISNAAKLAEPFLDLLLKKNSSLDPIAGCVSVHIHLLDGRVDGIDQATLNLIDLFPALPDCHVLRAQYLLKVAHKPQESRKSYLAAIERGVPSLRFCLDQLLEGVRQFQLVAADPRAREIVLVADPSTMDLFCSAWRPSPAAVCGDDGEILLAQRATQPFSRRASGSTKNLKSLCFADTMTGWIVGDDGVILKTNDSGLTWESQSTQPPLTKNLRAVAALDANTAWAVGDDGTVLQTTDGKNWSRFALGIGKDPHLRGVAVVDDRLVWVVGDDGTVVKGTRGALSWNWQPWHWDRNKNLNAVAASGPAIVWVVGDDGCCSARPIAGRPGCP